MNPAPTSTLARALALFVAMSVVSAPAWAADDETPVLLAQGKKKKKKKMGTKESDNPFGPEDIAAVEGGNEGVGIHRDHEGIDVPYTRELAGLTTLSMLSSKTEAGAKGDATTFTLAGQFLFILGQIEVGPDMEIAYTASEEDELKATKATYVVGGLAKVNFGNIDRTLVVPFVYAGAGLLGSNTKVGDEDPVKSTGFQIKGGGGLNLFIDSNVAFVPRVEFVMLSEDTATEVPGADGTLEKATSKSTLSGVRLFFGIGIFI